MATATRYFVLVLKITTAQNNFSYVSQLDGDDDEYRYRTCTRRGQIECAGFLSGGGGGGHSPPLGTTLPPLGILTLSITNTVTEK